MNDSHLVVADSRHLHVVGESWLRPGDRRAVPADYLDIVRTVFDLWRLAACGEFGFNELQQRSLRLFALARHRARKLQAVRKTCALEGSSISVPSSNDESAAWHSRNRATRSRRCSSLDMTVIEQLSVAGTN